MDAPFLRLHRAGNPSTRRSSTTVHHEHWRPAGRAGSAAPGCTGASTTRSRPGSPGTSWTAPRSSGSPSTMPWRLAQLPVQAVSAVLAALERRVTSRQRDRSPAAARRADPAVAGRCPRASQDLASWYAEDTSRCSAWPAGGGSGGTGWCAVLTGPTHSCPADWPGPEGLEEPGYRRRSARRGGKPGVVASALAAGAPLSRPAQRGSKLTTWPSFGDPGFRDFHPRHPTAS